MKNKKKTEVSRAEMFRYLKKGEMTPEERHLFERELQKDPFAMEALEGLEGRDTDEIGVDLDLIRKRISGKKTTIKTVWVIRAAASIAILATLSTLYMYIFRNIPGQHEELISENAKSFDIRKEKGISEPERDKMEVITPASERIQKQSPAMAINNEPAVKKGITDSLSVLQFSTEDKMETEKIAADELMAVAEEDQSLKKEIAAGSEAGKKTMAVQGAEPEAIPGAYAPKNIARTLSGEAMKTSQEMQEGKYINLYDGDQHKSRKRKDLAGAEPSVGWEQMNEYIGDNIRLPSGSRENEIYFVVIGFTVGADGKPYGFNIHQSPGEEYSKEAVRLLENGPLWINVAENNTPTEALVKITFR